MGKKDAKGKAAAEVGYSMRAVDCADISCVCPPARPRSCGLRELRMPGATVCQDMGEACRILGCTGLQYGSAPCSRVPPASAAVMRGFVPSSTCRARHGQAPVWGGLGSGRITFFPEDASCAMPGYRARPAPAIAGIASYVRPPPLGVASGKLGCETDAPNEYPIEAAHITSTITPGLSIGTVRLTYRLVRCVTVNLQEDFTDEAPGGVMAMLGLDGMFDEVKRMNNRQVRPSGPLSYHSSVWGGQRGPSLVFFAGRIVSSIVWTGELAETHMPSHRDHTTGIHDRPPPCPTD